MEQLTLFDLPVEKPIKVKPNQLDLFNPDKPKGKTKKVCSYCFTPIDGDDIWDNGKHYHEDCIAEKIRGDVFVERYAEIMEGVVCPHCKVVGEICSEPDGDRGVYYYCMDCDGVIDSDLIHSQLPEDLRKFIEGDDNGIL